MVLVDKTGSIVLINAEIERMFGYSRSELLGRSIDFLVPHRFQTRHGDLREGFAAHLSARKMGAGRELFAQRADLTEFPVEIGLNPIDTVEGMMVLGTVVDISERKHAEKELQESNERYRKLFTINPQPMWVFDNETLRFLEVNDAAVLHYGYSRDEFLAMTIKDIRPPEEIEGLITDLIHNSYPGPNTRTKHHLKKDGSKIVVEVTAHPLIFNGVGARLVLVTDITEKRSLADQLRQSQKMEAVGSLAGGIAHDFNNLLTAINGYTELALRLPDIDDRVKRNLKEVKRAGERAAGLTRQLLAFSRKQVLQPRVLDLNEIVEDIERMLRRLIGADIDLDTALDKDLGNIHADPGQIEQVIVNLVVNARDAMPDGGKLTIETANVTLDEEYASTHLGVTSGRYVMLAICDTGVGMSEEVKERAFEPFFTTKEVGRGTGLGLATVYGIVQQSSGNVWVYSEAGAGTTIEVYLPIYESSDDARDKEHTVQGDLSGKERVLVVEDDEQVRELTAEILKLHGYEVETAHNGDQALSICRERGGAVDLLLTDIIMPGMSGERLVESMAAEFPEIKVLYMSGYTDNAVIRRNVLTEGASFLQKPFSPTAMAAKVREVLDGKDGE